MVVPVPLHRERRRERGYNQAELIARPLADRLKLPLNEICWCAPGRSLRSSCPHAPSTGGRCGRAYAALEGARNIDNLPVLLVDDVLTTGATLDSCARALKKTGARAILELTIARVRSRVDVPVDSMIGKKADTRENQVGTPSIHSP